MGIVLAVIGIIMMVYTGFNYVTTEKVIDLGPIELNAEKTHNVQWPPIVGLVLIVSGTVLIFFDKKKNLS